MEQSIVLLFILIVFITGLYHYVFSSSLQEYMTSQLGSEEQDQSIARRCPNVLVQQGTRYLLYNTKLTKVPGVNPIEFHSLDEYTQFLEWQRSVGIRCPVLYVQHTYDIQGNKALTIRPSVTEMEGGLPPTVPTVPTPSSNEPVHQDTSYNSLQYPDGYNRPKELASGVPHIKPTAINPTPDMLDGAEDGMLYSDNPMVDNWGGPDYTQALVDEGHYQGNSRTLI